MRFRFTILAVVITLFSGAGAQAETADNPSNELLGAILMHKSGKTPNFETIARDSNVFRNADPFDKKKVLEEEIATAKSNFEATVNIDAIRLPVSITFGQYDFEAEGFPVPLFASGTVISSNPKVGFTNAHDFRHFKVEGDKARDIADKVGYSGVTANVLLTDLKPSPSDPRSLVGRVVEIEYTTKDGSMLGSMKAEAEAPVDPAQERALQDAILKQFDLPLLGTELEEARQQLAQNFPGIALNSAEDNGDYTRAEIYDYGIHSKDGTVVGMAFGVDSKTAETSVQVVGSRWRSYNPNDRKLVGGRFGSDLDCAGDVESDICGMIHFTKQNGRFLATSIAFAQEFPSAVHSDKVAEVFGDKLEKMKELRIETSLSSNNFLSHYRGTPAASLTYTAGDITPVPHPVFDIFADQPETLTAPVMIVAAQEQTGRALLVTTMTRPLPEADPKAAVDIEPLKEQFVTWCQMDYCSVLKQVSAKLLPLPEEHSEGRLIEAQYSFAEVPAGEVENIPEEAWVAPSPTYILCSASHPALSADNKEWTVINVRSDLVPDQSTILLYLRSCHENAGITAENMAEKIDKLDYDQSIRAVGSYLSFEAMMDTV